VRAVLPHLKDLNSASLIPGLAIAMAVGAASALAGMWVWRIVKHWRRLDPAEVERQRRLAVNACGRISTGKVLELLEPVTGGPAGPVLLYEYEVAGVTYQAAQDISALPEMTAAAPFLPGQIASVKYDPRQPTNSILACEDWCGVPDLVHSRTSQDEAAGASTDASQETQS